MLRRRFSIVSVIAMVLAGAAATYPMVWYEPGSFYGHQGFPFVWYWWTDVSVNDSPLSGYHWLGLAADIVFWLAVILALGLGAEWIAQRVFKRPVA